MVTGSRIAALQEPQLQPQPMPGDIDRERYEDVEINPIAVTSEDPVSTFSIDVDTASYSNVRRFLRDGELPPTDAVRIEEMVNYFTYDYPLPESMDTPFGANVTVLPNPWNADTELMHIGIQGYDIPEGERPSANLVFLIDVSGSMYDEDKLPLAVSAMHMLTDTLAPDDRVSIVVYAGAAGAILEPTRAADSECIHAALDMLEAGGSTAGGAGIQLAYDFARANFDESAINRIMLLTDGDFNVGVTNDERLEDLVTRERESGVYLSVMGFGEGNYNDQLMQTLAQNGNGIAAYIDSEREARRFLVEESFSALFPIANDVKIQVEFNPARVGEYRLVGYETRLLRREDFNNDAVDAGEIGSGHSVTAIYEIAAPGSDGLRNDPLRYGGGDQPEASTDGEYAFVRIRYKRPGEDESILIEQPVTDDNAVGAFADASDDVRFSVLVAGFAQMLREDPWIANEGFTFDFVAEEAALALGADEYGHRAEFVQLVNAAAGRIALGTTKPGMQSDAR
jgi:Ca-activated chloride channel family protein